MKFAIDILSILLPLLYFVTVWTYARAFFSGIKLANRLKTPLLMFTLFIHLLYLYARTLEYNHPPITTIFEIMSLLSFSIAVSYLYIELRTKVRETGYFILNMSFFFQLISSLFIRDFIDVNPVLRSNLLGFHVTSALLGYAAIAISAVYGFLYLMLYHDIKASKFGVIYKKLPNLEVLENMSFRSTVLGFVLLTIAIVIGFVWLPKAFQNFSYFDPKLIGTLFVWALYGVGLLAKRLAGWQGRKIVILSMSGFAITVLSMTIINLFFSSFHNFY